MVKPVSVVHIVTKMELGGAQQVALDILSNMDTSQFAPVLVTGPEGYLLEEARSMGFPVYIADHMEREIHPVKDAFAVRELRKIISKVEDAAIVHTHSSKAGILGRWAAHREGVPVIIHTIHGFGITPYHSPLMRSILIASEKIASRISTRLVAVSDSNRMDGVRWGIFEPEKCSVIYCGFDLDPVYEASSVRGRLEAENGIPHDAPLVLMAACLKPQKAPLDFVSVARSVRSRREDVHFMIAGDGELAEDVRKSAQSAGLGGVFHLLGWRDDVYDLMKSSDVVILTSRWEGLPLVIPQAQSAQRPVVATAVDGSVEAVEDGVDGFLCPPGDIDGMARRVLELIDDRELARRMGVEGRKAAARFSRNRMVRMYESLYESLLLERCESTGGAG